jgi:hypothetical protein
MGRAQPPGAGNLLIIRFFVPILGRIVYGHKNDVLKKPLFMPYPEFKSDENAVIMNSEPVLLNWRLFCLETTIEKTSISDQNEIS